MEVAASTERVPKNTNETINRRIYRQMLCRLEYYAQRPQEIDSRLQALDQEWDIERALEANASAIGLAGLLLTLLRGRRYLPLPVMVLGFLMQHALQGWCPPLNLFRRLGVRTRYEIEVERYALKILRGDFEGAGREAGVDRVVTALTRAV